jgi:hypothetical protein
MAKKKPNAIMADDEFNKACNYLRNTTTVNDLKALDEKTLRNGIRDIKIVTAKLEHQLAIRSVQGRAGK